MFKLNPKDIQKAMARMGVQQQEIPAQQVIIKCSDKDIVIEQPSVAKVNIMGQESFQITGIAREQLKVEEIKDEDIQTVVDQTGVSREQAVEAIKKAKGDLAKAILDLQG